MKQKFIFNRILDTAMTFCHVEGERYPVELTWDEVTYSVSMDALHDLVDRKLAERKKNQLFRDGRHDAWKK